MNWSKFFTWSLGLVFYGGLSLYCFDSSNSDGNRAIAAAVIIVFYIRHEFSEEEKRHAQLLERVANLEEKNSL